MKNNQISQKISVFHERTAPERGSLAGYGALINAFNLQVPIPDKISIISEKHKRYDNEEWAVFTPRHTPHDDLSGHLTFALKYEGVDLYIMKALFKKTGKRNIEKIILSEPLGRYSRKIWFLYEWLSDTKLNIPDLKTGNFVDLIDSSLQYPGPSVNSKRHRIKNNLPGVKDFCPIIRRTKKLDNYLILNLSKKTEDTFKAVHKDILTRAASFLLLKDSKASYIIEGEKPAQSRVQRWGRAIGQAGKRSLSPDEFLRLQQIVIENNRFIEMGWRKKGGFIGEHDRLTGTPIPDHISAKYQDIEKLINGLIETKTKLQQSKYDAVFATTLIAFGFVFIHPFVDGNGRTHRYLIHHILTKMEFAKKGFVFPVSAAMLDRIDEYRKVLEAYSLQRLDLIQWKETDDYNVEVINDTIDLYRYFDATKQAEFLYSCIQQTVDKIIPEEIKYLIRYDQMKSYIDKHFEMPDKTVSLLIRFLEQNKGKLSDRARKNEFHEFTSKEVLAIEKVYRNML